MKTPDVVPSLISTATLVEGPSDVQFFRNLTSDEARDANGTVQIFTDCTIKDAIANCTSGPSRFGEFHNPNFTEAVSFHEVQVGV